MIPTQGKKLFKYLSLNDILGSMVSQIINLEKNSKSEQQS